MSLLPSSIESNHRNIDTAPVKAVILLGGALTILSIGMLESFPLTSLRLRADAWSYDIVARSLSEGFGFKSNYIIETGTYPLVPIIYAFFYKILGVSYVTVVWVNLLMIVIAWWIICCLSGHFNPMAALMSLAIIGLWAPIWTSVGWLLSGGIAMLMLLLMVWFCGLFLRWKGSKHDAVLVAFLGIVVGLSALVRTEFYAIIPLILCWLVCVISKGRKLISATVFVSGCMLTVLPWIHFQNSNQHEIPEMAAQWGGDGNRVTGTMAKTIKEFTAEPLIDSVNRIFDNFNYQAMRPYIFYVYDVPPKRSEHYLHASHLWVGGLLMAALLFLLLGWSSLMLPLAVLLCMVIIYRTFYLSLLTDSPRLFSHLSYIVVAVIVYGFECARAKSTNLFSGY